MAAKRWVKPSEEILTDLDEQRSSIRLLRSHRRRCDLMAQFDELEVLQALFELPERAFEQAEKDARSETGHQPVQAAAKLHETALALAMLLVQPLRIGNLVRLDLEEQCRRDRRGRFNRIFVEPGQVKNSITIEFWLWEPLLVRFERHLAAFRPILLKGVTSSALFLGRHGQQMSTKIMGVRIRRLVEQQLGISFSPHLARHLAATLVLEADVNNLAVAQRLLSHARPETTARIYGLVRTGAAQGVYRLLVEEGILSASVLRGGRRESRP